MALKYRGPIIDRTIYMMEQDILGDFDIYYEISKLINRREGNEEINVLDIGCGPNANALRNIHYRYRKEPDVRFNLVGINSFKFANPIPKNIAFFEKYIRASTGLSFLQGEYEEYFDLIYSSFTFPYIGPHTFNSILHTSLPIMRDNAVFLSAPSTKSGRSHLDTTLSDDVDWEKYANHIMNMKREIISSFESNPLVKNLTYDNSSDVLRFEKINTPQT